MHEGELKTQTTPISPVLCTGGHKISGMINGKESLFLIDTGAGVSLLQEELWKKVEEPKLEPWSEQRLVSVDGSPIHVLGSTKFEISFAGKNFSQEMVVARSLTTGAILGLDFLQNNRAIIDLEKQQLSFNGSEKIISLGGSSQVKGLVCATETITIPPCSELEVMARVQEAPDGDVWILEEPEKGHPPATVARALVARSKFVPVRLLNTRTESVTVYRQQQLGVLESVEFPSETTVASIENKDSEVPEAKQQMLWSMIENSCTDLSKEQADQLYQLLLLYSDVFAGSDEKVGRSNKIQHNIDTGTAPAIKQATRRLPFAKRQEVHQLLIDMQRKDVIEPSNSPWASPIVLVQKKDGSTRFCVDYRKLNSVTRKDAYPLPRIDDTLSTLAGSQWFSTLDLVSGYWQVEIDPSDKPKTAFCTTEGLFQFKVMPFGLCNAPATFQRLMDLVLAGLQWSQCLVYLDDVIVLGRSFSEHLQNLQVVFHRMRQAGLTLKPSKCDLLKQKVQYLGHIVSKDGISVDPMKVNKVQAWPIPKTIQAVRQFLGFCSYCCRSIQKFAQITKPLHKLTEQNAKFK